MNRVSVVRCCRIVKWASCNTTPYLCDRCVLVCPPCRQLLLQGVSRWGHAPFTSGVCRACALPCTAMHIQGGCVKAVVSVVIHDVAPVNWAACQRVLAAVREVADVPTTLLTVPRFHMQPSDQRFEDELTSLMTQGHELALHGYVHLDQGKPRGWRDHLWRRVYTNGEGEFHALGKAEATLRLRAGLRWFARRSWPVHGFVAPAWLLSQGTWEALWELPLRYTATLSSVYALADRSRLRSSALAFSTRSLLRRMASVPRNEWVAWQWCDQPLVRLELHPHDADHAVIRRLWTRELAKLVQLREVLTLADAVEAFMPSPGGVTPPAQADTPLADNLLD